MVTFVPFGSNMSYNGIVLPSTGVFKNNILWTTFPSIHERKPCTQWLRSIIARMGLSTLNCAWQLLRSVLRSALLRARRDWWEHTASGSRADWTARQKERDTNKNMWLRLWEYGYVISYTLVKFYVDKSLEWISIAPCCDGIFRESARGISVAQKWCI